MVYFLLIAGIVLLDQLAKYFISSNMELHQSIPVIRDIFHITYIHNDGAAFRLLQGQQGFLILVTSITLVAVLVYLYRIRTNGHWSMLLSLALLCGGGIGNLIDRIRFRYVVDYLDLQIWPIFNIADICVVAGCGMLLIHMFYFEPRIKKEELPLG
ncbi:MAG: signal peptidase II [Firmicutes bacterium HGW-Firmicutes-11]|jgi:signal peptidase II|nr:MAG: signal peptidase II [Firmicutes bacterium HGW-Firmicutes-11]